MRSWRYCINGALIAIALIERSRQDFPAGHNAGRAADHAQAAASAAGAGELTPLSRPPAAEPDLLRQSRAASRIGRRRHRVIRRQIPAGAIRRNLEPVLHPQMTAQRLAAKPAFETHDIIALH